MTVTPVRALLLLLGAALLTLVACIQLDGQRIAWFHDVERDELRVLLFYDGIHDSREGKPPGLLSLGTTAEGAKQIPEFVEQGNVMLLDWVGVLNRGKLAKGLEGPGAASLSEAERRVTTALLGMQVEVLGWYREPDGRLGAAQRVVIPQVSALLADVNRVISEELIAGGLQDEWPRTSALCLAAARAGQTWVAFDGQALVARFPVQPDEWVAMKRQGLADLADDILAEGRAPAGGGLAGFIRRFTGSLAQVPVSLLDEGEQITVILGRRDTPFLTRALLRDAYEPSMEQVVMASVPVAFDPELAAAVLQGGTASDPGPGPNQAQALADVLAFGPPEERVRALLALDRPPGDAAAGGLAAAAWQALDDFAAAWNAAGRLPPAPRRERDAPTSMPRNVRATWEAWYAECRGLPVTRR